MEIALQTICYIKFREEVVKTHVSEQDSTAFEMEPRKDVKYS